VRTKVTETLQAGQKVSLEPDPYWVKTTNRVPALLLPAFGPESEINLDLPMLEEAARLNSQEYIDRELDLFLKTYNGFQNQIRVKNLDRATELLEELKKNHPRVHFLRFLEASLLVLKKDTQGAVLQLREGLKHHPEHEDGKTLLNKLGGNP